MYDEKRRINYYDLDFGGQVKLSALLRMVHIAADENARSLGIGHDILFARNLTFILQRITFSVKKTPLYGDVVRLRTWPDGVSKGTFIRKGDMHLNDKIMDWASMWILFDFKERKILKPSALNIDLPLYDGLGAETMPKKVQASGELYHSYLHKVRYADIDTNLHINNAIYGDLIGNAVFPSDARPNFSEISINYMAEAHMGAEVLVSAYTTESGFFVKGESEGKTTFTASLLID